VNETPTAGNPHPPKEAEDSGLNEAQAGRSLRNGLISLGLLIALAAGLLLAIPGLHGVARALGHMDSGWLVVAVGLEILSCLGYVLAFLQVFYRAPLRFGARVALSELAFGSAVSVGGAGSLAVGIWLLVERGAPAARVAERSAVLFLLTSAINVLTLVIAGVAAFAGLGSDSTSPLLTIVPAGVGSGVFVVFLFLPSLVERLGRFRAPGRLRTVLSEAAASINDTKRLLFRPDWRIVGAIGYLWFDIAVLVACFAALDHVPPLALLVLAYQTGYLSNFLPIPGNIGVLDASLVGMLVLYGVNATTATAATLVYHAIALWIPAIWGTIAFLILRRSRGEPLTLRNPQEVLRGKGHG
jgi:uncharacterized membrane protein YbhN (UPF0104 family)